MGAENNIKQDEVRNINKITEAIADEKSKLESTLISIIPWTAC